MQIDKANSKLGEIWDRLGEICRKLWEQDSPSAVTLQALIEEFKGEVHRVEQSLAAAFKALSEARQSAAKEFEDLYSDRVHGLESQLSRANSRISTLEQTLAGREKDLDAALKDLARKEAENVKFHDEYLKAASHYDEMQAKKMEGFYQELQKKGAEMESLWEGRQKALEAEYRQRAEALQKKHDEAMAEVKARVQAHEGQLAQREAQLKQFQERLLQEQSSWESRKLADHEGLVKRDEELKKQSQDLAYEYKRKQSELQNIKEGMQREIAEIVRQYQAKVKGQNAPARAETA